MHVCYDCKDQYDGQEKFNPRYHLADVQVGFTRPDRKRVPKKNLCLHHWEMTFIEGCEKFKLNRIFNEAVRPTAIRWINKGR